MRMSDYHEARLRRDPEYARAVAEIEAEERALMPRTETRHSCEVFGHEWIVATNRCLHCGAERR